MATRETFRGQIPESDKIKSNYCYLIEQLKEEIDCVIWSLYSKGVIGEYHINILLKRGTDGDSWQKVSEFLDILMFSGEGAYDAFIKTLKEEGYVQVAEKLEQGDPQRPRPQLGQDNFYKIPVWPLEERCTKDYPEKIKLNVCDTPSEMYEKYQSSCLKSDGQIYKMSAKVRGYVLVINNKHFKDSTLGTRHGTEVDAKAIKVLFKQLNFKVKIYQDLTYQAMEDVLQKFSNMNHSKFDCFICFILSHGVAESIICKHGESFPLEKIFDCFNGDNCPDLVKKPKIFFIQACKKGSKKASLPYFVKFLVGIMVAASVALVTGFQISNILVNAILITFICVIVYISNEATDDRATYPKATAGHHKDADIYKFFSTTLGDVSYRYLYGTRFIYTWIYVIEKGACKQNLMELQRKVNNLMQKFESVTQKLQTSESRSTSGKEFYFFPGLTCR